MPPPDLEMKIPTTPDKYSEGDDKENKMRGPMANQSIFKLSPRYYKYRNTNTRELFATLESESSDENMEVSRSSMKRKLLREQRRRASDSDDDDSEVIPTKIMRPLEGVKFENLTMNHSGMEAPKLVTSSDSHIENTTWMTVSSLQKVQNLLNAPVNTLDVKMITSQMKKYYETLPTISQEGFSMNVIGCSDATFSTLIKNPDEEDCKKYGKRYFEKMHNWLMLSERNKQIIFKSYSPPGVFTPFQEFYLNEVYESNRFPSVNTLQALSHELNMEYTKILDFFRDARHEKSINF